MLDHTGINVANMVRSKAFYDAALAPLGYKILRDFGVAAGLGVSEGFGQCLDPGGDFWISEGDPEKSRIHIAFAAETHAVVDAFHRAAIEAGGADNGAPGFRPKYHASYYAAFILDPDGYNIEVVCHGE